MTDCDSGRTAFFGGMWTAPCPSPGIHHIGSPDADPIVLCEDHFQEVLAAGLVKEPHIAAQEFDRREAKRTRPKGIRGLFKH